MEDVQNIFQARVEKTPCSCTLLRIGMSVAEEGSRLNQVQDPLQRGCLERAK